VAAHYDILDGQTHLVNVPRAESAAALRLPAAAEESVNMMQKIAEGNDAAVFKLVLDRKPLAAKFSKDLYSPAMLEFFAEMRAAAVGRADGVPRQGVAHMHDRDRRQGVRVLPVARRRLAAHRGRAAPLQRVAGRDPRSRLGPPRHIAPQRYRDGRRAVSD